MFNSLNIRQILQIVNFLNNHPFPAGIIANKRDLVIWRNSASIQLKDKLMRQHGVYLPNRTTDLHPTEQLNSLKKSVKKLKPIFYLPSPNYLEIEYYLNFSSKPIKVADRFYHLRHNMESYRIWFQLKAAQIG